MQGLVAKAEGNAITGDTQLKRSVLSKMIESKKMDLETLNKGNEIDMIKLQSAIQQRSQIIT
ncbi:MAG: hypothetical protein R3A47_02540 [Polyangiales bacterium]